MMTLLWNKQENMRKRISKSSFNLSGKFVPLLVHVLFFSEIEDYRKVLLYILFSCKWLSLILLWCLFIVWYVKVLAAGYLLKMWKNVTSNYCFETPYSFKRSIYISGWIFEKVIDSYKPSVPSTPPPPPPKLSSPKLL